VGIGSHDHLAGGHSQCPVQTVRLNPIGVADQLDPGIASVEPVDDLHGSVGRATFDDQDLLDARIVLGEE
jgi:hypothetical protein